MATIPNTVDPMEEVIENINKEAHVNAQQIKIPNLQGLNTEFAQSNKWWMYVPLANLLGRKYSNLELNVTRFAIPQMQMGSTTASFKGYSYEFPTKLIDASEKQIVIDYIVDSKWQNYRSLFKWCSSTTGQINKVINTDDVTQISMSDLLDVRVYLLDHFKNEIISFNFYNTWIKNFADLALEANNADEVHHQITLTYSNFEIEDA